MNPRPKGYLCVKCGEPGYPDEGTLFDARYALGRCLSRKKSCGYKVNLVRSDLYVALPVKVKEKVEMEKALDTDESNHKRHSSYVDECRHCAREKLKNF